MTASTQPNNPLHARLNDAVGQGKTLEYIVTYLHDYYGWEELWNRIPINCFSVNPSVKSSLKFLRKTEWARKKVEEEYIALAMKVGY